MAGIVKTQTKTWPCRLSCFNQRWKIKEVLKCTGIFNIYNSDTIVKLFVKSLRSSYSETNNQNTLKRYYSL